MFFKTQLCDLAPHIELTGVKIDTLDVQPFSVNAQITETGCQDNERFIEAVYVFHTAYTERFTIFKMDRLRFLPRRPFFFISHSNTPRTIYMPVRSPI